MFILRKIYDIEGKDTSIRFNTDVTENTRTSMELTSWLHTCV